MAKSIKNIKGVTYINKNMPKKLKIIGQLVRGFTHVNYHTIQ